MTKQSVSDLTAITPKVSSTTAKSIDGTEAFFIAHLVSSLIYHADVYKGKCDLRRKGLNRQIFQDLFDGEFSSILALSITDYFI